MSDYESVFQGFTERILRDLDKIKVLTRSGVSRTEKKDVYVCWFHWNEKVKSIVYDVLSYDSGIDCRVILNEEPSVDLNDFHSRQLIMSASGMVVIVTKNSINRFKAQIANVCNIARQLQIPLIPIIADDIRPGKVNSVFEKSQCIFRNKKTYRSELKKQLQTLVEHERGMVERAYSVFRAQVFISYRKTDVAYVKRFIESMQRDRRFVDIALWFDEQLVAGRDFSADIEYAIDCSDIFLLCLSPNATEKSYVSEFEYPYAQENGKRIIPFQLQPTDIKKANRRFKNLDEMSVDEDIDRTKERILDYVGLGNVLSSEDYFHLGIAYREGIRVKKNTELGIGCIVTSADMGNVEAMKELHWMSREAHCVPYSIDNAIHYQKKIVERIISSFDLTEELDFLEYISELLLLAEDYRIKGLLNEGINTTRLAYDECCKRLSMMRSRKVRKIRLKALDMLVDFSLSTEYDTDILPLLNLLFDETKKDYENEKTESSWMQYIRAIFLKGCLAQKKLDYESAVSCYKQAESMLCDSTGIDGKDCSRKLFSRIGMQHALVLRETGDLIGAEVKCQETAEMLQDIYLETANREDCLSMCEAYDILSDVCRCNGNIVDAERYKSIAENHRE